MSQQWTMTNISRYEILSPRGFGCSGQYKEQLFSGAMYSAILVLTANKESFPMLNQLSSELQEKVEEVLGRWERDEIVFTGDYTLLPMYAQHYGAGIQPFEDISNCTALAVWIISAHALIIRDDLYASDRMKQYIMTYEQKAHVAPIKVVEETTKVQPSSPLPSASSGAWKIHNVSKKEQLSAHHLYGINAWTQHWFSDTLYSALMILLTDRHSLVGLAVEIKPSLDDGERLEYTKPERPENLWTVFMEPVLGSWVADPIAEKLESKLEFTVVDIAAVDITEKAVKAVWAMVAWNRMRASDITSVIHTIKDIAKAVEQIGIEQIGLKQIGLEQIDLEQKTLKEQDAEMKKIVSRINDIKSSARVIPVIEDIKYTEGIDEDIDALRRRIDEDIDELRQRMKHTMLCKTKHVINEIFAHVQTTIRDRHDSYLSYKGNTYLDPLLKAIQHDVCALGNCDVSQLPSVNLGDYMDVEMSLTHSLRNKYKLAFSQFSKAFAQKVTLSDACASSGPAPVHLVV